MKKNLLAIIVVSLGLWHSAAFGFECITLINPANGAAQEYCWDGEE